MPINMPIMAITTNSSTSVKALRRNFMVWVLSLSPLAPWERVRVRVRDSNDHLTLLSGAKIGIVRVIGLDTDRAAIGLAGNVLHVNRDRRGVASAKVLCGNIPGFAAIVGLGGKACHGPLDGRLGQPACLDLAGLQFHRLPLNGDQFQNRKEDCGRHGQADQHQDQCRTLFHFGVRGFITALACNTPRSLFYGRSLTARKSGDKSPHSKVKSWLLLLDGQPLIAGCQARIASEGPPVPGESMRMLTIVAAPCGCNSSVAVVPLGRLYESWRSPPVMCSDRTIPSFSSIRHWTIVSPGKWRSTVR